MDSGDQGSVTPVQIGVSIAKISIAVATWIIAGLSPLRVTNNSA